jgi:hypothetical protein
MSPDEIYDKKKNLITFKPGESGNPNGRPQGAVGRRTIARQVLAMTGVLPEEVYSALKKQYPDMPKSATLEFIMSVMMVDKAIRKGDPAAYKAVMDSAYGPGTISLNEDDETAIKINIDIGSTELKKLMTNDKIE